MRPLAWWKLLDLAVRWLVPTVERPEWRARWAKQFWHFDRFVTERDAPQFEVRRETRSLARLALNDAVARRWIGETAASLPSLLTRSGAFVYSIAAVVLAGVLWFSGGFAALRAAYAPFPGNRDGRLVRFQPERTFLGQQLAMTARQRAYIEKNIQSIAIAGLFSPRRLNVRLPDGREELLQVALATPPMFALLGHPSATGLADGTLRDRLGSLRGKSLTVGESTAIVSAALPRYFRLTLFRPDLWVRVEESFLEQKNFRLTAIARLRPGYSGFDAEAELTQHHDEQPFVFGRTSHWQVLPLDNGLLPVLAPVWIALCSLTAVLAVWFLVRMRRGGSLRHEIFFQSKAMALVWSIGAIMTEVLARQSFAYPGSGGFFAAIVIFWLGPIVLILGFWWCWRDQTMRCRVCQSRMTTPVRMGTHANPLLEGLGSELICPYGHGLLWMPEAAAQAFGPESWRGM